MKIIPHFYQEEATQAVFDYFGSNYGNPVIVMPTGTGKSIVIATLLYRILQHYSKQKIIIATHVQELVEQNHDKLLRVWPHAPAGIYAAGLNRKEAGKSITFASIQSVKKKAIEFGHVDLLFIDEAHLVSPADTTMYMLFIEGLLKINPALKVVGLTATPWRLGQGSIVGNGSIFTDICYDISGVEAFNKLIEMGFLLPLVPKRVALELDVSGVHMRGGEFIEAELQRAVNKQEITYAALKETMEIGHDKRSWLIFCSGVDHANDTAEMLTQLGIPCEAVHSKRNKKDRKRILDDFKAGRLRAVTNNNVLTTGFDHQGLDLIVILRPTQSPVLWVQMLGRGTRADYGPDADLTTTEGRLSAIAGSHKQCCLVLDFARNAKRLGPINDPVVPRKKGEKGGDAPYKECDVCGVGNHASAKYCGGQPYKTDCGCGAEFSFTVKITAGAGTDALIKNDLPVVETFTVDHVTYSLHEKAGSPTMMKVAYYCGFKSYNEFVCAEHEGFALRKAKEWWRNRTTAPFPESSAEMVQAASHLPPATHLRIHTNKKYPDILAHCFDGLAFGALETPCVPPAVQIVASANPWAKKKAATTTWSDNENGPVERDDDDIPF